MKIQGFFLELGRCLVCDKLNKEDRARNCCILNSFIEFCKRNQVKAEITECSKFEHGNMQIEKFKGEDANPLNTFLKNFKGGEK